MTGHCVVAAALLAVVLVPIAAKAQAPVCVPPEEPWVPQQDADIQAYVDLVAADIERYFSDLTRYFQCLEQAWQDGLAHGRQVSSAREAFLKRARALGLGTNLGVDPIEPSGRRPE